RPRQDALRLGLDEAVGTTRGPDRPRVLPAPAERLEPTANRDELLHLPVGVPARVEGVTPAGPIRPEPGQAGVQLRDARCERVDAMLQRVRRAEHRLPKVAVRPLAFPPGLEHQVLQLARLRAEQTLLGAVIEAGDPGLQEEHGDADDEAQLQLWDGGTWLLPAQRRPEPELLLER